MNLLVVSIVNNEPLCVVLKALDQFGNAPVRNAQGDIVGWESANWDCYDEDNVVRQLQALHEAEQRYPWYRIAMNPWHARRIIAEGDLAVVISMETDKPLSGQYGNYGDWEYQLDLYRAMGMTTMQIVHQSNNPFAGAALHRNLIEAVQAVQWPLQTVGNFFENLIRGQQLTAFNVDNEGFNERGLTEEGGELVDAMVARNMPIDLAHGSLRTRRAVMGRVPDRYGLYDSHTKFERLLTQSSLDREQTFMVLTQIIPDYVANEVMVGLRTSPVDLRTAPNGNTYTNANDCPGSAKSFMQTVKYASDQGLRFAFGSDFNTGVSQLGPRFGPDACWAANANLVSDPSGSAPQLTGGPQPVMPPWATGVPTIDGRRYYEDGLANIGWLPELTRDLIGLMGPGGEAEELLDSAENFLQMWERAYEHSDATEGTGSRVLGATCTQSSACSSGLCREGRCVCSDNGDCPTNQFCDVEVDLSLNVCRTRKPDGDPCPLVNGGDRCLSGNCAFGRCYTPNSKLIGDLCWVGAECAEGRCNNVVDGTQGTCVCTDDTECGLNQYCDGGIDFTYNQCRNKKVDWSSCDIAGGGHQCLGDHCAYSRCYTPDSVETGDPCFVDRMCESGRCSSIPGTNGTCVCNDDNDCPNNNQWCDGGVDFTQNQCRPKRQDFDNCPAVGGGHACLSGNCRYGRCFSYDSVSHGGACFVDDQCIRGQCSSVAGTNGTCVCRNDNDCTGGVCITGTLGIGLNYCAATRSPTCPSGWSYEIRNPLNRDRCRRTTTQTAALKCKLKVGDKQKNWTGPHAQSGRDECRSVKNKPPRDVKCPSGYTHNVRSGADTCTKQVTDYRTPSCPSGWDYHSQSGRDICRDLQ